MKNRVFIALACLMFLGDQSFGENNEATLTDIGAYTLSIVDGITTTVDTVSLMSDLDIPIGFSDSEAYGDGIMPYFDPGVPAGSTITDVELEIILTTFGASCESDIVIQITDPTGAVFGPFIPFTTCQGTIGNNYTATINFTANSISTGSTANWIVDFLDSDDQNPSADEFWVRYGLLTYQTLNPAPVVTNISGEGTYCEGTDIILTADAIIAGMTYEWTGPNGFTYNGLGGSTPFAFIPNVALDQAGVYTLTLTSPSGCTSAAVSVNVAVEAAPDTPELVANDLELCEGDILELSVTNPVASGDIIYQWFDNPAGMGTPFATTNTPNVLVTNSATLADAGEYTAIVTNIASDAGTPCNSLVSNFITVYVEGVADEATNTEDYAICEGEAIPAGAGVYAECVESVGPGTTTVNTVSLISDLDVPIGFSDSQAYGDGIMPYADPGVAAGSTITDVQLEITLTTFGASCESDIVIQVTDPTGAVFGPFTPFVTCNGVANNDYTAVINFTANTTSTGSTGDWTVDFLDSNDQNAGADEFWARYGLLTYDVETTTTTNTLGNLSWWNAEVGGSMIGQGETYAPADAETLGAGTYTYWAQCDGVCPANRVPVTLTVNPKPATLAISQNGPVCEGDSVQLCISFSLLDYPDADSMSYTYISSSGSTSVMSATNTIDQCIYVTEAGEWTGYYTVYNVDGTACDSDISAAVEVEINAISGVIATNGGAICPGDVGELYGAPTDADAVYTWTVFGESTIISTDQNPVITNILETTIYELTVTLAGCSTSDTTTIIFSNPPVVNPVANYTLNTDCSLSELALMTGADTTGTQPYSYNWSGPNGFSSVAENPVIPNATSAANGQYSVTVTDAHGCFTVATTDAVVDINDPVAQPVITSSGPTCEGGIVVLTVSEYSGSNVNYEWSHIDGIDTINAGTLPNVTGENSNQLVISPVDTLHEGEYFITVMLDGCELTSDIYNLDIYNQPVAIPTASTPDNCEGSTLSLFANAPNIDPATAVYFWTGPNGFTSNAENPQISNVTVANNGTYTVEVTSLSGCSITASVNVNNIMLTPTTPTIATNSPVCEIVDNIILTVPQQYPLGATYTWLDGTGATIATDINGDATDTQASITIDYDAVQPFSVVATLGDCNSEVSQTVSVVVNELPIASATNNGPVCSGDDVQLFAGPVPSATYEWTIAGGDGTVISTAQNPTIFNILGTTTYEVTVIANGCVSNPIATTTVNVSSPELATNTVDYEICEGEVIPAGEGLYAECVASEAITSVDSVTLVFDEDTFVDGNDYATNGTLTLTDAGVSPTATISDVTLEMVFRVEGTSCERDIDFRVTNPSGMVTEYIGSLGPACNGAAGNDYMVNLTFPASAVGAGTWTVEFKDNDDQNTAPPGTEYSLRYGILRYTATEGTNILGTVTWWDAFTGGNLLAIDAPYAPVGTENFAPGTYTYWAECGDPSACPSAGRIPVNLIVNPAPATPAMGTNTPLCEGTALELSTSAACDTYYWIGPGGSSSQTLSNPLLTTSTASTTIPSMDDAYEGGMWYVICEDANGCSSESAAVAVTIDVLAAPIVTNTTVMEQVCEGEAVEFFTDAGPVGANITYEWYFNGQPWIVNGNPVTDANPVIDPASPADNGSYVVTVTIDGCQSAPSAPTTVEVTATPATPVATTNSPVCEGEPIQLNTDFIQGATYEWIGPAGFTSNLSNPFIPVADASNGGEYIVYITIDGCSSALSTPVVVVVNGIPAAPTAINTSPACVGEDVDLIITTTTPGAIYTWYNATTNLVVGMGETLTLTNVTMADAGNYYVVASLNGCTSEAGAIVSTTTVEIDNIVLDAPDAGDDMELCGSSSAQIEAVLPSVGTGSWSSPTGATITNPNQPITTVQDLQEGQNTFVWTIANGACASLATDTMYIIVSEIAIDVAFAGINQELCESSGVFLDAEPPVTPGVVGTWTQSTAQANTGVVIDNPNDPNTSVSGLPFGAPSETYTFTWTLSNGVCGDFATAEVTVTNFSQPADNAYAGEDMINCGDHTAILAGVLPTVGEGLWTQSEDQESAGVQIITDPSGTSVAIGLQDGVNTFVWSLYNGACSGPDGEGYSSDAVVVTVQTGTAAEDDLYVLDRTEDPVTMTYDATTNDDLSGLYGGGFTVEIIDGPTSSADGMGTIVNNGDGTFDYLPGAGFYGTVKFTYQICSESCESLCSQALVTFTVEAPRVCIVPNLFTPNMDGMNDSFEIPCLDNTEYANNNLMVFNRWGDKVYEAQGYQNDWYGTFNGKDLPEGTYYYIIDLGDGSTPMQGFVMIQR